MSQPPQSDRVGMGTIMEDLGPENRQQRRLSVMNEKRAMIDAILTLENSGSAIKSFRSGGFRVNLMNTKSKCPKGGQLPPGFQHTFCKLSADLQVEQHAPTVSTKMLLKKASTRLVEPLEAQRKAKLSKQSKARSDLTHGSVLTSNYDKSTIPASQAPSQMHAESVIPSNIRNCHREENDLKTPDDTLPYSGLTSQNIQQRNLMKTHGTNFYKPQHDHAGSIDAGRETQPSPLFWDESRNNNAAFDDSDLSNLKFSKQKIPSMVAQTEEEFRKHMRKTL